MLRSVLAKTLHDARRQILGWGIGAGLLAIWLVAFYPFIRDSDAMAELLEEMPPAMMSAFGIDVLTFTTGAGYLSGQLYSFIAPILIIGFGVSLGVAITAAEEHDNTMDMLLSAPISRTRIILSKLAASILALGVIPISIALVLAAMNGPFEMKLSLNGILSMNTSLWLLGLLFGAIAAATGSFTGNPVSARGVALSLAILSWFVTAFESFFNWLEFPAKLSPFTWYMDRNLFLEPWSSAMIWLFAATAGFALVAIWLFARRDIATELAVLPDISLIRRGSRHVGVRRPSLLGSVAGKSLWDRKRTILYWAAGIASLLLVTFSAWPALSENSAAMESMVNALPTEMFAMFGMTDPSSLTTPAGFISSRAYLNMGPLIIIVFTVGGVSALVAREERSGVLDMVLSNPLTRRSVLLQKVAALAGQSALIGLVLTIVAFAGNAIWDTDLVPINMVGANVGLVLIGLFFGGMALALWSLMASGGSAVAITSGVAIISYFVNGLGSVVEPIGVVRPLSPFYWYIGDTAPLAKGIEPAYLLLLIGALAFTAVATWHFDSRDLAT